MNRIEVLTTALEYIETNLSADIKTEDVAAVCYCSKAALEKMFRCLTRISVHDYIIRRRMMLAARTILEQPEVSLLDVALSCGYSTNESFSRAFKNVWNCNPSEFRGNSRYSELFPRLLPPRWKNDTANRPRNVDITELYELFQQRRNCYFICCDVDRLTSINEISRKAGDLVILETLKRLERAAGEEDIPFRIGGDEFTIITNSEEITYAERVCERIRAWNGDTISFEHMEIPVKLHIAITKLQPENLRHNDLFDRLHHVIQESKHE